MWHFPGLLMVLTDTYARPLIYRSPNLTPFKP